ncbi:MAG TPA: hypothetical protein VKW06_06820 [Candidatus Angelobacter sp.]|nr:hypothetical protein [Candidatus Angelobacter sp.]
MSDPDLRGTIISSVMYDVADEIDLGRLRALTRGTPASSSLKHAAPDYVRFERPPMVENVEPVSLASGERLEATLQYYDYGVVGLLLRSSFSGSWEQLRELAARWISGTSLEELSRKIVAAKIEASREALVRGYDQWLSEEYYILHLHGIAGISTGDELLQQRGAEISQMVRGENLPLAGEERNEVLESQMSYYPNDLLVAGWNAAFLFDTEAGAEPTIRLIEYANSQLLQFRHYDEVLTRELDQVYRFLRSRRQGMFSGWRMGSAAARLRAMLLEVTELTEHTNNALKFVGDMFSARLYKMVAVKIGVNDYQNLVHEKLRTADELYDFMIEQFHQSRGFLLEFIVVLILVIELFFLFRGK